MLPALKTHQELDHRHRGISEWTCFWLEGEWMIRDWTSLVGNQKFLLQDRLPIPHGLELLHSFFLSFSNSAHYKHKTVLESHDQGAHRQGTDESARHLSAHMPRHMLFTHLWPYSVKTWPFHSHKKTLVE